MRRYKLTAEIELENPVAYKELHVYLHNKLRELDNKVFWNVKANREPSSISSRVRIDFISLEKIEEKV